MDRPRDYHTKQSKSERESQISHDIIYMCDLKKKKIQMNLFQNRNRLHRHRKQIYGYQRRKGGRRDKLGIWD